MNTEVMFSRQSDEWATPQDLFDRLHAEFRFTLDPCATPENAKCERYYTAADDGLQQPWRGTAFVNPPYSQVGKWVEKARSEWQWGATVVMLLPARTDTRWFHAHIWDEQQHRCQPGVELRLLKGRLRFGGATNSAPFPSMIVVFHHRKG